MEEIEEVVERIKRSCVSNYQNNEKTPERYRICGTDEYRGEERIVTSSTDPFSDDMFLSLQQNCEQRLVPIIPTLEKAYSTYFRKIFEHVRM